MTIPLSVMGHDEIIGYEVETVYGTQIASAYTAFSRPSQFTLAATPRISPLLGPSGYSVPYLYDLNVPRHFRDRPDRAGQIMLEVDYDTIGHWLAQAIEDPTTTDGALAAQHVFQVEVVDPATMPPSLTVHHTTGLEAQRYGGVMVNQMVLRGQAGQYVTCTMDVVAATGGTAAQAWSESPTYSTNPFAELFHSDIGVDQALSAPTGTDWFAGSGADVIDWTLTINNNLRVENAAGGASIDIAPPVYGDYRTVELEFTHRLPATTAGTPMPLDGSYLFDRMHGVTSEADSYRYVSLYLDQGTDAGDGTNTGLRFAIPHALFLGDPVVYEGGGGSKIETVRVAAAADGSVAPLIVSLDNDNKKGGGASYGTGA